MAENQDRTFDRQTRRLSGELQRPRTTAPSNWSNQSASRTSKWQPPALRHLRCDRALHEALRLLITCALTLTVWAAPARAAAAPAAPGPKPSPCAQHEQWAARCAEPGFHIEITTCPDHVLIVSARSTGGAPLGIEIREDSARAFRRVGSVGVQPIGEFPDWNQEPTSRQDALERTLACIARVGPPDFSAAAAPKPGGSPRLLVLGLLLMLCAAGLTLQLRRGGAGAARKLFLAEVIGLGALALAVGWSRWLLVSPAPFHQNGQAPLWIAEAARVPLSPGVYGPGFEEVFGWFASHGEPDFRVHLLQSVLLAASVPLAHFVTRVAGAGRVVAWLACVVIGVHPLLARLAGGESYMATIVGLGMLAAGSLALAAQPGEMLLSDRRRLYLFLCGIMGAACLIAQAARIHPIGWLSLATLGLVIPCLGGPLRTRALRSCVAGLMIAALVGATSLVPMLGVLHGELGQKWLPATSLRLQPSRMLLFLPLWLLTKRRAQDLIPVVSLGLCVELALATNSLRAASRLISDAYVTLYLPATLVALAAYLASLTRSSLRLFGGVACAAASLALGLIHMEAYLSLPTDAREVQLLTTWLRETPKPGSVLYLGRAGDRVLLLPNYDPRVKGFSAETNAHSPPFEGRRDLYYYRSSLCSTDDGRATCQDLESHLVLEARHEVELPARPSLPYLPLPQGNISVGWYSVKSTR